jgi:hypothetical protein
MSIDITGTNPRTRSRLGTIGAASGRRSKDQAHRDRHRSDRHGYENPLYMLEEAGAADLIAGGRLQLGVSRGSPDQVIEG